VVISIAGGYVGFRIAADLDLADQVGAGLIALAVVTGAAVVFSPCSFPLLVTLLGGSERHEMVEDRRSDGLRSALAIAAGAAMFLLLAGLAVGVAGEGVTSAVNFSSTGGRLLRSGVAAVLVGAGLIQLGVIHAPLSRVTVLAGPLERRRLAAAGSHRRRGQAIYGFAFVLAGFG
jgi:cytochrome c biogenesis protein CcdA